MGICVHIYVSAMLPVTEEPGLMFRCHDAPHDEVLKFLEDGNKQIRRSERKRHMEMSETTTRRELMSWKKNLCK